MANINIKRYNGDAWEIHYPKTTIGQVINLSSQLANMQSDIDGKLSTSGKAADSDKLDGLNSDEFGRVTPVGVWHGFTDPNSEESGFIDGSWVNRFNFFPTTNMEVESSSDDVNYSPSTEYPTAQLKRLVGGDDSAGIAIPNLGTTGIGYKRFTFSPYTYVSLSMLYMWTTTVYGSLRVKVEKHDRVNDVWEVIKDYTDLTGWPSHHTLKHQSIWWSSTQPYDKVRLTFRGETTDPAHPNHTLHFVQWWGGYPVGKREIYGTDENKNVNFPAQLKEMNQRVYSPNNKPTPAAIGAATATHSHPATAINVGGRSVIGKSTTGGGTTQEIGMSTLQSMLGLGSLAYSSATIPTIPTILPIGEGSEGITTTAHTISAQNLVGIIQNISPPGARTPLSHTLASHSGTLTLAKGGTGSTTASGARSNLGLSNVLRQVSLSGGTLTIEVV